MLIDCEKVTRLFMSKIQMFSFPQRTFTRKTLVIFDTFILKNYNMKFNYIVKLSQQNSRKGLSITSYLGERSSLVIKRS